jgi:hypothetical protein
MGLIIIGLAVYGLTFLGIPWYAGLAIVIILCSIADR